MAAVLLPAIVVMNKAAGAGRRRAAGHRQAGGLIGQEPDISEILNGLACAKAWAHFDSVVASGRARPGNGRLQRLFAPGCIAPPDGDNGQQQDQNKYLRHATPSLPDSLPKNQYRKWRPLEKAMRLLHAESQVA